MRIFKLEWKRIMKTKMTWVLLLLALLLSIVSAYLPVTYCYSSYQEADGTETVLKGVASIAYEKKRQAAAAGVVTPKKVQKAVEAYQACLEKYGVDQSYDLPEGVYEQEILPYAPLLHGVKEAFADPDTGMAPAIMEISPQQLGNYYEVCEKRLAALMKMEQPDSPAAQKSALRMYQKVKKPFYVYPGASSTMMDYQNIMGFLVLLFCVVIAAPVFSADYQSGADEILRCTKYGRKQLGTAKVAAALSISAAAFAICSAVYIVAANSLFGWECTKTSVQMIYSIVTLAGVNLGQLQWIFAAAGLFSVMAAVSFTLLLSAKCKNTVTSLAVALVFCMLPVVACLTVPGVSAWICSVLPASGVSIQASILYAMTDFQFLHIGGLAVWVPAAMAGMCILEVFLFPWLTVRSYCKHTG